MALLRRDVTAVAKKELAANPIVRLAGALADAVFIDRDDRAGARSPRCAHWSRRRCCAGKSLAVAPEGTRSGTGRLGPFKKGAFRLAMAGGVPVMPIVFRNANDVWPLGTQFMRPGTVDVVVHPPIPTDDWTDDDLDAAHRRGARPLPRHARRLARRGERRPQVPRRDPRPARGRRRGSPRSRPPRAARRRRHRRARRRPAGDGGDPRRTRRRRVPAHRAPVRPHRVPRPHPLRPAAARPAAGPQPALPGGAAPEPPLVHRPGGAGVGAAARRASRPPTSSAGSTWRSGRWARWDAGPGSSSSGAASATIPVYKLALREYVGWLAEHRQNLEWYIEGGRTRTGKLRDPRLGPARLPRRRGARRPLRRLPAATGVDRLRRAARRRGARPLGAGRGQGARVARPAGELRTGAAHPLLARRHPRRVRRAHLGARPPHPRARGRRRSPATPTRCRSRSSRSRWRSGSTRSRRSRRRRSSPWRCSGPTARSPSTSCSRCSNATPTDVDDRAAPGHVPTDRDPRDRARAGSRRLQRHGVVTRNDRGRDVGVPHPARAAHRRRRTTATASSTSSSSPPSSTWLARGHRPARRGAPRCATCSSSSSSSPRRASSSPRSTPRQRERDRPVTGAVPPPVPRGVLGDRRGARAPTATNRSTRHRSAPTSGVRLGRAVPAAAPHLLRRRGLELLRRRRGAAGRPPRSPAPGSPVDLAERRAEFADELHELVRRARTTQARAAARFLEVMRGH